MDISKRIEELSENPELLHDTNPREFEQIVAELLASFGWQVNVTPASKDGGYDILGITTDGSELQTCLLYTSPSPRDKRQSRMPSSA